MNPKYRPARTESQTCKENTRIARREPDARSEICGTIDDKGLYLRHLQHGGSELYTAVLEMPRIFLLTGRLAGSGESHRLQGIGGVER